MVRDKRFLTGLGAGLMIGAMLLQLMNVATGTPSGRGSGRNASGLFDLPDREELEEEAARLGLVLRDAGEELYTREEVDALLEKARGETKGMDGNGKSGEGGSSGGSASGVTTAGSASGVTTAGSDAMPHFYLISIRPGMTSDEVGKMLHAAGLLDDLGEWRREMASLGLSAKIRAGTYSFAYKPDLSALIDAITLKTDGR